MIILQFEIVVMSPTGEEMNIRYFCNVGEAIKLQPRVEHNFNAQVSRQARIPKMNAPTYSNDYIFKKIMSLKRIVKVIYINGCIQNNVDPDMSQFDNAKTSKQTVRGSSVFYLLFLFNIKNFF